jgi:hypothetical protein
VDICKYPVLGRAVRQVELSYTRFLPDCFGEESKGLFGALCYESRSEERHEYLDGIRRLANRCDEEEIFRESGDDENLLATAFTALSKWDHPLELHVSDPESPMLNEHEIYGPGMLGQYNHWECDILGTVSLLYLAATFSGCVVQRLQIQGPIWNKVVDSSTSSLSTLAQLPELELDTWPAQNADSGQIPGYKEMVTKLLQNATGLKSLELESYRSDNYLRYLHEAFSSMSVKRLEKLTLFHVNLEIIRATIAEQWSSSVLWICNMIFLMRISRYEVMVYFPSPPPMTTWTSMNRPIAHQYLFDVSEILHR